MRRTSRVTALLALVCLGPWALDGCVSMRVTHGAAEGPASVEVTVYSSESARQAQRPVDHPVFTHLFRVEGSRRVSVARSLAPRWRLADVPPGRYRLEVAKEIDARGDIRALPNPGARTFDVAAGGVAHVDVVTRKVPVVLIVLAAVTVVALTVLLVELGKHGHLPPPPPLPPLPIAFDVGVAIDLSFAARAAGAAPHLAVVDVFPARGSVVAARRVAVSFLLGAPVGGADRDAVQALGSLSGEIAGAVSYLPEEQILRFQPERDFTPGETVTVTLDLARLHAAGSTGSGFVSTSFRVPER